MTVCKQIPTYVGMTAKTNEKKSGAAHLENLTMVCRAATRIPPQPRHSRESGKLPAINDYPIHCFSPKYIILLYLDFKPDYPDGAL